MNLLQHVLNIRKTIHRAFDGKMERLGIGAKAFADTQGLSEEDLKLRNRLENITLSHIEEKKGNYVEAREYTLNQCVFTLFNRLAAIKLMESKEILPEVIRQRADYGGISQSHLGWLEEHPEGRQMEREGLVEFFCSQFEEMGNTIPLYKADYPYAMMPVADELNEIVRAINAIDDDPETADSWKGDDILGWLYENFNAVEKDAFKRSGDKTEYHKVSLQSQVYTPDWVVKFLVDNTLGKQYLEMFPDSTLALPDADGNYRYPIVNRPTMQVRSPKDIQKIRVIDPACGSGNFLLYAFDVLYDMYLNQNEQYGKQYDEKKIAKMIVENNLYGVDLDERAVQLAQIALMIKAGEKVSKRNRRRREYMPEHTNVVSTNFFLPAFEDIRDTFEILGEWTAPQKAAIGKIWNDLSNAYKFGTLVRVEEQLSGLLPDDVTHSLFAKEEMENLFSYKNNVITQIHNQVLQWSGQGSNNYTLVKMNDAVSFLEILSRKFDVVVANPPYTDSGDFGPELKAFVEANYRVPMKEGKKNVTMKFNSNLYACFIKRCCELAGDDGKVGMIHPHTFMFIKTFEDVRKYMLEHTHINVMVDYGLDRVNLFGPGILLDATFYTLDMNTKETSDGIYFNITANQQEKYKKGSLEQAYNDCLNGIHNDRVYTLPQSKLKGIKSYPFIYWISDEFREKFKEVTIEDVFKPASGAATSDNNKYLRFWWEVCDCDIPVYTTNDSNWVYYAKGGPYNKWAGNLWLFVKWHDHGNELKGDSRAILRNPDYYFKEGVTYSASGSKGASFRLLPKGCVFDVGGASIFPKQENGVIYLLGLLNSKLSFYIVDCLNPTVNTQVGDMGRIPFIGTEKNPLEVKAVETHTKQNVGIKKYLCQYSLIEPLFSISPIGDALLPQNSLSSFYNEENSLLTLVLLNESIINKTVFEVYELNEKDKQMVLDKEGIPVGDLPVSPEAKAAYKEWLASNTEFPASEEVLAHLDALEERTDIPRVDDFDTLYTNNKEWEEFCIQHNMNPVEVWYQFKLAGVLPPQRTQVLAFELLTDVIRTILAKDDDGIIPLTDRAGEETLLPRIEAEMIERGYSNAQIAQVFSLVCGNARGGIQAYLNDRFFQQLSDHLNLFMYLPKTPFIWHITSGEHHAMELYISIYKWNRDAVMRIKSVYVANRESALNDRLQMLLQGDATQKAEAVEVKAQLAELRAFTDKLDTLLDTNGYNYNPKLDDGVGKNIAPLQQLGIISYEVLKTTNDKKSQLNKYLNADW